MSICKFYVLNRCNKKDCQYTHIKRICKKYFFHECTDPECVYIHDFKYNENRSCNKGNGNRDSNIMNSNNMNRNNYKNTESFIPDLSEPHMRVKINEPLYFSNEITIINNMFYEKLIYENLLREVNKSVFKPWHGDTHLIANDRSDIKWKDNSETFNKVISQLCSYFAMTASATRLNYYADGIDWKPYHHDAAALKPEKAKTQNITVGVTFGITREISFESVNKNKNERQRINFTLHNNYVYAFGNKINTDFRHGIPQLTKKHMEKLGKEQGRISIIIWGYSSLVTN